MHIHSISAGLQMNCISRYLAKIYMLQMSSPFLGHNNHIQQAVIIANSFSAKPSECIIAQEMTISFAKNCLSLWQSALNSFRIE